MSNEASIEGQTSETIQADPQSQAAGGSDTQTQGTEPVIQPAQESAKQQPPASIPYDRFAESRRELAETKRMNQQLLEALNRQNGTAQAPQSRVDGPPTQDQFNSFEDWQIALGRYGAQQEFQSYRQQEDQRAQQTRYQDRIGKAQSNFSTKMAAAMTTDPSLYQVLESAAPLRQDLQVSYMELDNPDIVGKHLALHPEIVMSLNQMYPDQAARELAKLDVKLAGPSVQAPKVSQMPKPMTPVGSGKGSDIKHANDYSKDDVLRKLYPQ